MYLKRRRWNLRLTVQVTAVRSVRARCELGWCANNGREAKVSKPKLPGQEEAGTCFDPDHYLAYGWGWGSNIGPSC
jgi:hypothetical protein